MSKDNRTKMLPEVLRQLREKSSLPQRKVASALDIDTATYCKIENGKYLPNKEQVEKLSQIFGCDRDYLVKIWLADKLIDMAETDNRVAYAAIRLAYDNLKRDVL